MKTTSSSYNYKKNPCWRASHLVMLPITGLSVNVSVCGSMAGAGERQWAATSAHGLLKVSEVSAPNVFNS